MLFCVRSTIFEENARALAQRNALVSGDFNAFLQLILESWTCLFCPVPERLLLHRRTGIRGLSVALALSQTLLEGQGGSLADAGRRLCRDHCRRLYPVC